MAPKTTTNEVSQFEITVKSIEESTSSLTNLEFVNMINMLLAKRGLIIQPRINVTVVDKDGNQV